MTSLSLLTRLECRDGPDDGHVLVQDFEGHRDETIRDRVTEDQAVLRERAVGRGFVTIFEQDRLNLILGQVVGPYLLPVSQELPRIVPDDLRIRSLDRA